MTLPAHVTSPSCVNAIWWDDLQRFGPAFGFYVNPPKCWLDGKPQNYDLALEVFEGTGVHVSPLNFVLSFLPFCFSLP